MKTINIGILSTAHIHTKSFIENIVKATDGRRVGAIWDDVSERGKKYAAAAGAPFRDNIREVIDDPAIDGFIICAENTRHLPLLREVIPAGKPVFCEKPLLTTTENLSEVRALAAKYRTPLFCGYMHAFDGKFVAAQKLVAEGALGTVTRARFRNAHHAAYGRWFDNPDVAWFTDPELSGGGALMDMGTHAVHALRSLLGPARRVWAHAANQSGVYPRVDDFGMIQIEFVSGVLGTVEAAWTQTGGHGGLEIVGSKATIWQSGGDLVIGEPGSPARPIAPLDAKPDRVNRLIAIIRGEVPQAELDEDLSAVCDAVSIMTAAYRSIKSGTWEAV